MLVSDGFSPSGAGNRWDVDRDGRRNATQDPPSFCRALPKLGLPARVWFVAGTSVARRRLHAMSQCPGAKRRFQGTGFLRRAGRPPSTTMLIRCRPLDARSVVGGIDVPSRRPRRDRRGRVDGFYVWPKALRRNGPGDRASGGMHPRQRTCGSRDACRSG